MKTPKSNNLKLESISPEISDKYSKNLYEFLKRNKSHASLCHVYEEKDGSLLLGWWDDGSFIGNPIQHILTGTSKSPYSYSFMNRSSVKEVRGFWSKYMKIGVCAIDIQHQWYDDRWDTKGKSRKCKWCGCNQVMKSKVVRKTKTWWENSTL